MSRLEYFDTHPYPHRMMRRKPNGFGIIEVEPMYLQTMRFAVHELMNNYPPRRFTHLMVFEGASDYLFHAFEKARPNTTRHNKRVRDIAVNLALAYNNTEEGIHNPIPYQDFLVLEKAALLHDIGKIGIPLKILKNARRNLSTEENQFADLHTFFSYHIVSQFPSLKRVAETVLYHHEYLDGTGLFGFKDSEIPLIAQILTIADKYDASRSNRPESPPERHETAVVNLKENKKNKVNQTIVDILASPPAELRQLIEELYSRIT